MLRKAICAIGFLFALAAGVFAYEIRVSRLNSWELTFTCNPPRAIEVVEKSALVNYRYVVYEVKNDTSQDVDFFPTFAIETEQGKLYTASIYPAIAKRVQQHFGRDVLDATKIAGVLKAGETRRGVAVFRDVDGTSDVLTVYVSGLSGDLKVNKSADGKVSVLYRTYKVMYARAGDEFDLALDPVTLKSTEWVWRP